MATLGQPRWLHDSNEVGYNKQNLWVAPTNEKVIKRTTIGVDRGVARHLVFKATFQVPCRCSYCSLQTREMTTVIILRTLSGYFMDCLLSRFLEHEVFVL